MNLNNPSKSKIRIFICNLTLFLLKNVLNVLFCFVRLEKKQQTNCVVIVHINGLIKMDQQLFQSMCVCMIHNIPRSVYFVSFEGLFFNEKKSFKKYFFVCVCDIWCDAINNQTTKNEMDKQTTRLKHNSRQ